MKPKIDYSIYLCTDRELMSSRTIEESIELALMGGATLVQLREKTCNSRKFYELSLRVKKITEAYHIPLIINDRVDIALAAGAQGVHIGQSDIPCAAVKKLLPNDMVIGVSATNVYEAVQAELEGADYIGVGAMYATGTKSDAKIVTLDELKEIRVAVKIPIVVIGGINKDTISSFKGIGVDGAAVVSAIVSQEDVKEATSELLRLWRA